MLPCHPMIDSPCWVSPAHGADAVLGQPWGTEGRVLFISPVPCISLMVFSEDHFLFQVWTHQAEGREKHTSSQMYSRAGPQEQQLRKSSTQENYCYRIKVSDLHFCKFHKYGSRSIICLLAALLCNKCLRLKAQNLHSTCQWHLTAEKV